MTKAVGDSIRSMPPRVAKSLQDQPRSCAEASFQADKNVTPTDRSHRQFYLWLSVAFSNLPIHHIIIAKQLDCSGLAILDDVCIGEHPPLQIQVVGDSVSGIAAVAK